MLFVTPKWKNRFYGIPVAHISEEENIDIRINSDIRILCYTEQDSVQLFKNRLKTTLPCTLICIQTKDGAIYHDIELMVGHQIQISPMFQTEKELISFIRHLNNIPSTIQPILPIQQHDLKLRNTIGHLIPSKEKGGLLFQNFGNLKSILQADVEQLQQVVSQDEAQEIYSFLHVNKTTC